MLIYFLSQTHWYLTFTPSVLKLITICKKSLIFINWFLWRFTFSNKLCKCWLPLTRVIPKKTIVEVSVISLWSKDSLSNWHLDWWQILLPSTMTLPALSFKCSLRSNSPEALLFNYFALTMAEFYLQGKNHRWLLCSDGSGYNFSYKLNLDDNTIFKRRVYTKMKF